MSIRYKIFLILLLAASAALGLTAYSFYYYSQSAIKNEMIKHLEAMANVQHERVEEVITHSHEMLRLISSRTQLRISFNAYQRSGDPAAFAMVETIMKDALEGSRYIDDLFIMGSDGRVVGCVSGSWKGKSLAEEGIFRAGKEGRAVALAHANGDHRAPVILFSAPLLLEGKCIGVIAMQVNMDYFNTLLIDYVGLGRSGEVLMATETPSKKLLFFTPLRFSSAPVVVDSHTPYAVPMKNALLQREMLFEDALDYRGERVFAVTRYIEGVGIGIVVKIDRSELLAARRDMNFFILYSLIVMVVIAGIVSVLLARMITQPVIDLMHSAMAISKREFGKREQEPGHDELEELAKALNLVDGRLIEANATLEKRLEEKTRDLRIANEKLEKMVRIDGLTGIANRRMFDDHLHEEWQRCMRAQMPLALIMIDIDFFKAVNDTMGHQKGDAYLQAIAHILKESVHRAGDLAARYGGEEFVVVMENTSAVFAESLAEMIRKKVIARGLEHPASEVAPYITVSAGVAAHVPELEEEASLLIKAADSALYRAKQEGRNRVVNGNRHS